MVPTLTEKLKKHYTSPEKLMTAEKFAEENDIPLSTVKRRWMHIKGGENRNGEIVFWPGSRYPYNIRFHKLDTDTDKSYVLLKAISKKKYISHKELKWKENEFDEMLENYLLAGYIKPNIDRNPYGANAYNITDPGHDFLEGLDKKKREKRAAEFDRFLDVVKKIREALPTPTITIEQ